MVRGIWHPLQWFGHPCYQLSKPCPLMLYLNVQIMT
jgi:hypothetical protein